MRRWSFLIVALAACGAPAPRVQQVPAPATPPPVVADPPMRPLVDIPRLDSHATVYDEHRVFEWVQQLYRRIELAEVDEIALAIGPKVLVPYAGRDEINTRRFLVGAEPIRAHLDVVSRVLYGGRIDLKPHFANEAEALEGYRAFMTALVAHELVHSIAAMRSIQDLVGASWLEESRAMWFEWPVLTELARQGRIPATWPALYVKFNRALLAAAPPGMVATLPTDDAGRAAAFRADYVDVIRHMGVVPHPHPDKVDRVLALYSQFRLERAAQPAVTLESLAQRLAPADPWAAVIAELVADARPSQKLFYERVPDGRLRGTMKPYVFYFSYERARTGALVTTEWGYVVPAPRRAAVSELLVRIANRYSWEAFELGSDGKLVVRGVALMDPPRNYFVPFVGTVLRHIELVERWQPAIAAVVAGKPAGATFDATVAAEDAALENMSKGNAP